MKKVITFGNGSQELVDISPVTVEIPIKYFDTSLPELGAVGGKSDWIDLYSRVTMFIVEGTFTYIPLNVAMALPDGYEAHIVPRSSTFKNWGLIQTNHHGVVDGPYCGDNDEWMMPVYCVPGYGRQWAYKTKDGLQVVNDLKEVPEGEVPVKGTFVMAGDRVCQFRIDEHMAPISFREVPHLTGKDRGGFGTTGKA